MYKNVFFHVLKGACLYIILNLAVFASNEEHFERKIWYIHQRTFIKGPSSTLRVVSGASF